MPLTSLLPEKVIRLSSWFCTQITYRRFPAGAGPSALMWDLRHWLQQRIAAGLRGLIIDPVKVYSSAAFAARWVAANRCGMCCVSTCPKDLLWKQISSRSSLVVTGLGWGCLKQACSMPTPSQIAVSPLTPAATSGIKINKHWQGCSDTGISKRSVDSGHTG